MAIAPEALEAGAGAGEGSAVTTSQRMPRQGGYKTPAQVGQLNSDNAEYEDMKRREAPGRTGKSYRPVRASGRSGGASSRRGGGSSSGRSSAGRAASGGLRVAGGAITKAGKPGFITKLIYAGFAGLVALELASLATGTPFKLQIPVKLKPAKPGTYRELYPGQYAAQGNLATKPATVPGVVH